MSQIYSVVFKTIFIFLSLLISTSVLAYKFSPLSVNMSPHGRDSRQTFQVQNPTAKPIAIELKIYQRQMTQEGLDKLKEDKKNFIIHPTQIIVMPNDTQTVRLQWIGGSTPTTELAYRLISEQVPVSFDKNEVENARVKFLVKYIASVYITPKNAKADIKVTKTESFTDSKGKAQIKIYIENSGSAHTLLRKPTITFTSSTTTITLNQEQLPMLVKQNILSGHVREFIIPKPGSLKDKDIQTSITYSKENN